MEESQKDIIGQGGQSGLYIYKLTETIFEI